MKRAQEVLSRTLRNELENLDVHSLNAMQKIQSVEFRVSLYVFTCMINNGDRAPRATN
jgi:hypothetical protein